MRAFDVIKQTPGASTLTAALSTLALGASLAGCGAAPAQTDDPNAKGATCSPDKLEACEKAIAAKAAEGGTAPESLVAAYAAARSARDPSDAWAKLWGGLTAKGRPARARGFAAFVDERPGGAGEAELGAKALPSQFVAARPLPPPKAIATEDLLIAMGGAAGAGHIIRIERERVTELFPNDPMGPFMGGIRPVIHFGGAPSKAGMATSIDLAAFARRAIEAAREFRYVDAAKEADALAALIRRELAAGGPRREPLVRALYAFQLLASAGVALEPEGDTEEPPNAEPPPPSPADTPYGDLLRVRTAKDVTAAWTARGPSILAAIPSDRREAFTTLYKKAEGCAAVAPPPMEGPRDLVFAARLAASLARTTPDPTAASGAGQAGAQSSLLPLPDWYRKYKTLVDTVAATRSAWSYAPSILYERGEAFGLSPAATSTHARVTELGAKHLAASLELERAFPLRFRALTLLPFVYSPGVLNDERLREAVLALTQATVQDKIARASDAKGVFDGALAGLFAGMSYPPAVQAAHFLALQGAITAKLKGDLLKRTGWGVAGLYAADAAYRIATDQGKNLAFSADQIGRALTADPSIQLPSLAALATSLTRYAALGFDGKLNADGARTSPERRAAKEALRQAIAGLGERDEAPAGLLDDVTELTDGIIAALARAASEGTAKPDAQSCPKDATKGPSPETRRALAKLGDIRRRVLLHPKYKAGEGLFVRRARLLVTLLSDAMDIAGKTGERAVFTIPAKDAEQNIAAALREWDERAAADALASGYGLVRELLAAKSADTFLTQNAQGLRKVLNGLVVFFRGEGGEGNERRPSGVALLDAIAKIPLTDKADSDLMSLALTYAEQLYAAGNADQGDLWLLTTLVLSGLTESPPSPKAVALAAAKSSRIEWALRFLNEIGNARRGVAPDPSAFEAGMRRAGGEDCGQVNAGDMIAVTGAVRDFLSGRRSEARAALDKLLEGADTRGLFVPKMIYKYEEKTATKVFSVSLNVSYGGGLLVGSNTFQIGLGLKTRGEPEGSMTAVVSPTDSAQGGEESARYYVHAAALAAVYHFLEGDPTRASGAARRAVGALAMGVRLGQRLLPSADPVVWGADARAALTLAAQLAAEAGMPFLAGDLWTVVRASLPKDHDDAAVAQVLEQLPFGLAGVKEIAPVRDRAARTLKIVASPLPCTEAKVDLLAFEEPACDAYPLALSLRIADVVKKLPRIRRGDAGPVRQCTVMRALDGFLSPADKGTYDPDAFMTAVEELRAEGHIYDAATVLARHKRPGHCSPAIIAAARSLASNDALGPLLRSDLYSTAINCSLPSISPELVKDLAALDAETKKLPDPGRNLSVVLFATELSLGTGRWEPIAKLASAPDFVDRWMNVSPTAALAALLIQHAAAVLAGPQTPASSAPSASSNAADTAGTRAYSLLCDTFPGAAREAARASGANEADMCDKVRALRPPFKIPEDARKKLAREAIEMLVKQTAESPKTPPP